MRIRILIDMNLSTEWVTEFTRNGFPSIHWSKIGDPRETDSVIMSWAKENKYVVFTHDLDFSTALALTHATGPSVLQIRGQKILPGDVGQLVITAIKQHESALISGALVAVDLKKSRIRVLPI